MRCIRSICWRARKKKKKKVTEAVITWNGWGQIKLDWRVKSLLLKAVYVVGEVSKLTPSDQYRSGDLKVASSLCRFSLPWNWREKFPPTCQYVSTYEGCPESIQTFWISREPVALPWWNLAASQMRPYCASANSRSPVGLVSRQWDAVDWACVLCDRRIHKYSHFQRRF